MQLNYNTPLCSRILLPNRAVPRHFTALIPLYSVTASVSLSLSSTVSSYGSTAPS